MSRRPWVSLPGIPHHIIQRGNNRSACFYGEEDYLLYLEWLSEYAKEAGCQLHAYVLMTNHVHCVPRSGGVREVPRNRGLSPFTSRLPALFRPWVS